MWWATVIDAGVHLFAGTIGIRLCVLPVYPSCRSLRLDILIDFHLRQPNPWRLRER